MIKNERRGFWKDKKETLERAELEERLRKLAEIEPSKDVVIAWCYFKSPDRVGKEQIKMLSTIHECLGRRFTYSLTALLRTDVDVKPTVVEQVDGSELICHLDNPPTYFNLLRAEPLKESWFFDINPSILYPLIDFRLNGGKEPAMTSHRSLIEVEKQ